MTLPAGENKIAIVIPWFGRTLKGGAEQQAWNLAVRLSARGYAIEVITTCCRSFQDDWASNHLEPGLASEPEGFAVRRFPVEARDRVAFDQVCGHLLGLDAKSLKPGVSPITEEDEQTFREHLIRCPQLLAYLEREGWRYSAFIFLPYLYGPILDGLPLVASRAFLQPCLHDEAYAYLRCVQRAVFAARGLLWLSEGEYELGRRLFGPSVVSKSVIGMAGIEPSPVRDDEASANSLLHLTPFVLLLGRKDVGKGTLLAVDAFKAYHVQTRSSLRLVVAGPGELAVADTESNIHDLGLVSEGQRSWLLENAVALIQPSPNESFSRVMFEAWQYARPVAVHQACLATAQAVIVSGGGWVAKDLEEWTRILERLDAMSPKELAAIGQRGATYAAEIADWSRVMDRYDQVLRPLVHSRDEIVKIRCTLSATQPQHLRLLVGGHEAGRWTLEPGASQETGWIEAKLDRFDEGVRFETKPTDSEGSSSNPSPPRFRLENLALQSTDGIIPTPLFYRGWNRSEGDAVCPRWSTGTAELVLKDIAAGPKTHAIHQVLPNLGYGDAIGNHTLWIRDRLQSLGYHSEIYARYIAPEMLHQAFHIRGPESLPSDAALIYHHSIGTEITPWICRHPGPKALIYHNITPANFFADYRPEFAEILRHGRDELPTLAPYFAVSVGDSRFNADELKRCGFVDPEVFPLCIDPAHWAFPPDERVMETLQDGRTNILFVGRIVPNKRHEDLIYTFKFWLEEDPEARLFLVGTAEISSFYLECLQELARRLRVGHAVHFVGQINDRQLHAYYRGASMFWCFSEHEGFCVPLIEACVFGVPVIARAEGAVADTLGDAGLLLHGRADPAKAARLIAARRPADRDKMQARVDNYSAANVTRCLESLVTRLLSAGPVTHQSAKELAGS